MSMNDKLLLYLKTNNEKGYTYDELKKILMKYGWSEKVLNKAISYLKKHPNYLEQADLIITLTETHKKEVLKCLKSNDKVILTLREFAGETGNIEDPSMKGLEGFRIARDEIKRCVMKGLQRYF